MEVSVTAKLAFCHSRNRLQKNKTNYFFP